MHHLLTKVLSERDLSRAGDLFSVADSEIINDITNVLSEVEIIISQSDYIENKNDQSVVEICVTRVISCIRETKTFERYCQVLVNLLECCLKHNLQPGSNNEDPPHAKISSDIIASIFLNYNKKAIMEIALPVAVKFLQKANKELSRNIASYLSLAAIEYVYLLSPYVQPIIDSILTGNYGLCRVLPQLYEISPNPLVQYTLVLVALISQCDLQDKLALLQLFGLISENEPAILENSVSQLCDVLADSTIIPTTMNVLLKLAEHKPILLIDHLDYIKNIVQKSGTSITTAAQIFTAVGKGNKERAQFALDFVLEHLPHADRTSQGILLREATLLCSTYPILFTDKVLACVRKKNILSQQQLQLQNNQENKMSGNVTIVKLNSTSPFCPTNQNTSQTVNSNNNNYDNIVLTTVINTSNGTTSSSTVYNYANNNNTTTSGSSSHVIPTANVQDSSDATTDNILSSPTNIVNYQSGANTSTTSNTTPTATHTGYTRRAKLGDSRSTGRLHSGGNTHRSGSVGGLHKSMTRLSSSQQINQNGINPNSNCHSSGNVTQITSPVTNQNYVPPVPPLSSNVIVTGHNKWGIPSTKITSGGVTVTTSPSKGIRPHSQGPGMLMGSTGALGKGSNNGLSILNHSTGSIGVQQNTISVHHGSPDSPIMMNEKDFTLSTNTMPNNNINQINVTGGVTVTTKRNDNTSVTLLNASSSCANQRLSVFEPYPMRDTVQHFCEKHLDKIKLYMESVSQRLPPPAKCTIEERRSKKLAKLHFACQVRGPHCLYSKTFFTMKTRNPKTWIHLMFLDLQARAQNALSSRDSGVSSLKHCWDILKCENKTFVTLITRAFPDPKEQDTLVNELRNSGFFDVFELGPNNAIGSSTEDFQHQWGCFLCNHPDKAIGFLNGNTQPVIEGQLKEKKGKWRLFRRWRTRYFTLSGAHLSCKGSSGGESIDINQIRSVKVSRGARNIPKAFEIFTGNQTLILKPKDGKNAEEWVQCLSIVVAHSQARDNHSTKTNSLPARGIGGSRTAF